MTNTALLANMIQKYNELSYTHNYIYGFTFKGNVYKVTTTEKDMPFILKVDKASRGAGHSLRFKPTVAQKTYLMAQGAELVCSKDYFLSLVKASKYNRGEIFEKMVTESFGQTWKKDSVPFTEDGDVTANGIAYQVKFEQATFVTEKTLARL